MPNHPEPMLTGVRARPREAAYGAVLEGPASQTINDTSRSPGDRSDASFLQSSVNPSTRPRLIRLTGRKRLAPSGFRGIISHRQGPSPATRRAPRKQMIAEAQQHRFASPQNARVWNTRNARTRLERV